MPTALLIGATGHVGKALMAELAPDHAAGRQRVRVAARSAASSALIETAGLEAAAFDFADRASFGAAMAGIDTVFLLRPYTLKQLIYGKQVIDSAVRAGVRHIVTIGAYGAPDTPWDVIGWNFLVEAYAERSGMGWTHLRPNYFMDNIIQQRVADVIYNRITRPVSWVASEDIAAVAAAVIRDPASHAGKAYPLAVEAATTGEISAMFAQATGRPHSVVVAPRETMMARLLAQGREPDYAQALVDYVDAVSAGQVPEIADTFDTVKQVAGRPATSWKAFLARRATTL